MTGYTLALDAAASVGTVALLRDGVVIAASEVEMRSKDEERFLPAILSTLAEQGVELSAISRVICGEGPGSFTSLRVVAATAKGLVSALEIPLYAVPSLALIVGAGRETRSAGSKWIATLNAMRGDRFAALVTIGEAGEIAAFEALGLAPSAEIEGLCARYGASSVGPDERMKGHPHARGVERALGLIESRGAVPLDSWEPVYGRLAEAQAKLERERGKVG